MGTFAILKPRFTVEKIKCDRSIDNRNLCDQLRSCNFSNGSYDLGSDYYYYYLRALQ